MDDDNISLYVPTPTPEPVENDVNRLREDATRTAQDIIEYIQSSFITKENFAEFRDMLEKKLTDIDDANMCTYKTLTELIVNANGGYGKFLYDTIIEEYNRGQERAKQKEKEKGKSGETSESNNQQSNEIKDNVSTSTRRDADNDVIMKNTLPNLPNQIPDPGFFTGNTSDTDLFCQLCEDTFRSYPNCDYPEETKINFVKSRLRDSARSWYFAKYKDDSGPYTMKELIFGLKKSFSNIASYKLAKIKLTKLKQNYGKINDYIQEFRMLTTEFIWDEEALTLFFYNGLHPKYQEEIEKAENFPITLEDIITKCILFEGSLSTKNQIRQTHNNKSSKRKNINNNNHIRNNFKNQNFNNKSNSNFNQNNNYNSSYNNKFNSNQKNDSKN